MTRSLLRRFSPSAILTMGLMALPAIAAAEETETAGALPWEQRLNQLADSLSGPVIRVVGILAIIMIAGALAVGAGGSAMKSGLQVVLGLTIAASAVTFGLPFLGFGLSL